MVEKGISNPLLDEVLRNRKAKQARIESEAKAAAMLPDFKVKLGMLIADKIPPPEVIVKTYEFSGIIPDDACAVGHERWENSLTTHLLVTIAQDEGGPLCVKISASGYPKKDDPDSAKALNFEVNVHELDRVLIIQGLKATEQSKQWETKGIDAHSFPAWSRTATFGDLLPYKQLIEGLILKGKLGGTGVTFEGKTPPIIQWNSGFQYL